jgi:hypothetical protein
MKNTGEGHSRRLEQVEDRNSEFKDKIEIQIKNRRNLSQTTQELEKSMQELSNSIRQPNLRIMGIEEGEEVQAKGMYNIFNKIITENFPNIQKVLPILVQEDSKTPNRLDQNRTSPWHIIIKTTSTENNERTVKSV